MNFTNTFSRTALFNAVCRGEGKSVELLTAAGANVNIQDKNGYTALIWVAHYSRDKCAAVLIAAGTDVNIQNEDA